MNAYKVMTNTRWIPCNGWRWLTLGLTAKQKSLERN